jgi:hypothetical protein
MLHDNQRLHEPENLFDTISTLAFMLHFYCSEFALLFSGLCIDLVLLTSTLCRQLCECIPEMIFDFAEGRLASSLEDEWDEETDCDPIRVPAELLWIGGALMMDVALDLLWLGLGGVLSPFYALVATLFTLPLLIAAYPLSEETANLWHASYTLHQFRVEAARFTTERVGGPD